MSKPDLRQRVSELWDQTGGNTSEIARLLDRPRSTVQYHVERLGLQRVVGGKVREMPTEVLPMPKQGEVKRYILTSAQNNTRVHEGLLSNILALCNHYNAELIVGSFTYDKASYGPRSTKRGKGSTKADVDELWYDPQIEPYFRDKRMQLAPGLVWCGEMNILPTAVRPLTGLETYTGRKSGIFPHAKLQLQSVASGKHEPSKINYTTGCVTQRNYIQKKAGIKAEFHHVYGGLLVEVTREGWWVRQLVADEKGTLYDLELVAQEGEVFEYEGGVEAITWGDIHAAVLDEVVAEACWGIGGSGVGMVDVLRPRHQVFHDLFDGLTVNHHERGKCHERFERHVAGWDSVEKELLHAVEFLRSASREYSTEVVVDSNHDVRLKRWLQEGDYRNDPGNAELFLELQLATYRAIRQGDRYFHLLGHAMRSRGTSKDVKFLLQDESYTIANGQIECGMHGDLGPNGTRGTPQGLSKMGRRANTGHTHSAEITEGLYVAGTSGRLDQGYNKGPSSWTHSHVVTYPNGKRTVITLWNGRWRA